MPKVDLKNGSNILIQTIAGGLRHIDYDRVVEIAKDYTAYTTGVGAADKLQRFNPRETEEMFKQRVALTQVITPDIANSIMNPMYKVGRTTPSIYINWSDKEKTEKNMAILKELASEFYGKQSVDDYLSYRMVELDSTDPNSFIVVEFEGRVDPRNPETKAKPYPFEVSSKEAINYQFINNELAWLIVLQNFPGKDGKGKAVILEKYTAYIADHSIVAFEIHKDLLDQWKSENSYSEYDPEVEMVQDQKYLYELGGKGSQKKRYFIVEVFEHLVGYVPAIRVGVRRDLTTRGRTMVPLMHPAQPYFEKSIKTMSEFDLTNCIHTFPQKIQYTDACPGYQEEDALVPCMSGRTPTGTICKSCSGSGFKVHTSAQDMIQIRMPKDPKDMINLDNLLVYKHPPIELLDFQKKLGLYELRHAAQRAVYNADVFSRDEIAVTATEKNIDLDAVYDTLQAFAKNYSLAWVLINRTIAILRDIGDGLTIDHKFPTDFKMKPLSMLLADLKLANENSAPSYVKKALTKDITRILYVDQPEEVLKIETKDKYFPFPGKTESEINYILANDLTTQYNKIFYAHFDLVFADIEYEQNEKGLDFYKMAEKLQREIVEKKVLEYIAKIEEEDFNSTAKPFGEEEEETPINPPVPPTPPVE